jgi:Trehalose receptor
MYNMDTLFLKERQSGNKKVPKNQVSRGNRNFSEREKLDDSFVSAVAPVVIFVQFLGLMPVCGAALKSSKALKFKLFSLRVAFTCLYIAYGIFISVFCPFSLQIIMSHDVFGSL